MDNVHNKKPKISVLVPIYNVEKYIDECLSSVQKQSFEDFEVICINDGSTDSSASIVDNYVSHDSRFQLITKVNTGYGDSMNCGIKAAKGDYIAILESDDFYEPDALRMLYDSAQSYNCDIVKADFNLYWSDNNKKQKFGIIPKGEGSRTISPLENQMIFLKKPSIWSALYRREFLLENDVCFLATPGASYQDTSFSFKAFASAKSVHFLDFVVLNYRQDNEASSINSISKVSYVLEEYDEIERYLMQKDIFDALRVTYGIAELNTYLWNYDRLIDTLRHDFFKVIRHKYSQLFKSNTFIDLEDFPLWAQLNIDAIVNKPDKFENSRTGLLSGGKIKTFEYYISIGGIFKGIHACIDLIRHPQF